MSKLKDVVVQSVAYLRKQLKSEKDKTKRKRMLIIKEEFSKLADDL